MEQKSHDNLEFWCQVMKKQPDGLDDFWALWLKLQTVQSGKNPLSLEGSEWHCERLSLDILKNTLKCFDKETI